MNKIISLSLAGLLVLGSCSGNRFLRQKYTHFRKTNPQVLVAGTEKTKSPDKEKIPDPPLPALVTETAGQAETVLAEAGTDGTGVQAGSMTLPSRFTQKTIPELLSSEQILEPLSQKEIKKENRKKFIFGLIRTVLGLVLFILILLLIITLLLMVIF
jgi:hypothetical protein